jgi:predicted outer membrane protein
LENDHNTLLRELQTLANNSSTGNDSLPTSENEMARHHQDMMKNLTGQEFDRQWLQHMHMMHEQKVQMFEQAESNNSVQDAQLRIWMNKTLPTLRKHRDMLAQQLNSQKR